MKVLSEKTNILLKRKEVLVEESYESNPGFERASKDVSAHFKVDEANIAVKKVGGNFGSNTFMIEAMIYDSEDLKKKIEPRKKEKKK